MNVIPGFTAEAPLNKTKRAIYWNRATYDTAMGRHNPTSNLIQPSYVLCDTLDWVDFWLETGIITDYGGTICYDMSPLAL